jgi:glutathione synthase/RimK-type ligase-like ATP-grasp enzyme
MKKTIKFVKIRSKHPSHDELRKVIPATKPVVLRLGSTTEMPAGFVEINHKDVARISGNKKKMKMAFNDAGVKTADWWTGTKTDAGNYIFYKDAQGFSINNLPYPIVAKSLFGAQGKGNTLIKSEAEFTQFLEGKNLNNYLFERYYNYLLEFRLHVTSDGCFYACRKAMKADTPAEERWRFHSDTSIFFLEENDRFFKPNSWNDIVEDCVAVLDEINADVLAFDVKVQSAVDKNGNVRDYQDYILIEMNSAPSLLSIGIEKYKEIIPKIIASKI